MNTIIISLHFSTFLHFYKVVFCGVELESLIVIASEEEIFRSHLTLLLYNEYNYHDATRNFIKKCSWE